MRPQDFDSREDEDIVGSGRDRRGATVAALREDGCVLAIRAEEKIGSKVV